MGSGLSLQYSCDETVNRLLYGKGYIRNLKKNLKALETGMIDLRAIQEEVNNKLSREEEQHRIRLESVKVWLARVASINKQCNDLLSTKPHHLQKLCLCGLCSKNVCLSYNYGKNVFLLLEEVNTLNVRSILDVVTEFTPIYEGEERPTRHTVGHEKMLKKAWDHIMKDEVNYMGLHGMGGVGKTTIFKKIHNKFIVMGDRFDVVIWVVVSYGAEMSKIQDDIAEKLQLCGERWRNKSEGAKAAEMYGVLKRKKFVLMLDDIWDKVDLDVIGVPFPTKENECKVSFTTRSLEVCGRMGDHKPMQVNCLEWKEAWELFNNKVGVNTLQENPIIEYLAKKVAEKCRGLPLALSVIGETMASKTTVQEWEHAVDVLTKSAADFPDMENEILPILKFSYDSLVDGDIKSCFLYCAMFPEDYAIDKERLIEYWICEGFLGECKDIRRAKNKGYEVLGSLIRANLLVEDIVVSILYPKQVVRMHDVVREMALWIASYFGKHKGNFVVQARLGLREIPKINDWRAVRRMSFMDNKLEEITCSSKCSEVTTLFLQKNNLKNLSRKFIQSMKKLVVLDLSGNRNFNKLPEQISQLKSLQYLDLSRTDIEVLPSGIQELKMLILLNLTYTRRLCSISGISKLSSLRILKLLFSKCHGDDSVVKELQQMENLQVLSITISTKLGLELISCDQNLATCIYSLEIHDFKEKPVNISFLMGMENLWVNGCNILEISTDMKCGENKADASYLHNPTTIPCFTNLYLLKIEFCNGTKDLTWLMFAPNLANLTINHSGVEEIINEEKATNLTGITPFQKLKVLSLSMLPKLESIYWNPLPFPFLRHVDVYECPKLRKLPLDSTSVPRVEEFSIEMDNREQLEWEDEDTQNRFLPSFNQITSF